MPSPRVWRHRRNSPGSRPITASWAEPLTLPVVDVDLLRIAEVLTNLIENRIKYTGSQENPEIKIGQLIEVRIESFCPRQLNRHRSQPA